MNNLNQLIIEGKCTGEKDVYDTAVRFLIATVKVATVKDERTMEFPVFAYGELARVANEKIKNGKKIRIVGRLARNKWTDETGRKQASISIVAEHIELEADDGRIVCNEGCL